MYIELGKLMFPIMKKVHDPGRAVRSAFKFGVVVANPYGGTCIIISPVVRFGLYL